MRRLLTVAWMIVLLTLLSVVQAASSIEVVDSVGNVGQISSLALDSMGNPVISYQDTTSHTLKLAHCNDPDCTGGDETISVVDNAPFAGAANWLALDSSGNPVISYSRSGLGVAHCNDPNCIGGNESLEALGDSPMDTSIALDGSGYPVISYYQQGSMDLKLVRCNDPNCAGGDESIEILDSAGQVGPASSLTLDGSGYPIVSYVDVTNSTLKLAHCNDPNCTGGDESIVTVDSSGDVEWGATSLMLDSSGNPVISYWDGVNFNLKVAHCNDPNCTGGDESIVTVDSIWGVGHSSSMRLDASGNPIISYFGSGDLKVVVCNDPNCAGNDESIVRVDTTGNVGWNTALALDANGYPVISYYDDTNRDLKLVHCDTLYCVPLLSVDDVTVDENAGTATFTLSLGTTGNDDVVVDYTTADDSAIDPDDYTRTARSATIRAGNLSTTLTIPIIDDTTHESSEQFFVTISAATNAYIADNQGVGTITDDDAPPVTVTLTPTATMTPTPTSTTVSGNASPDSDATAVANDPGSPQVNIFDPAISKLGLLVPGQVGVTGEQLEWAVTVSNTGSAPGHNVVITDAINSRLHIDRVDAPGATVTISGQTVTVTYPTLGVGQSVEFSIFTTVLDGVLVFNTACVMADNQAVEECATGLPITQLPRTGEMPYLRGWVLWGALLAGVIGIGLSVVFRRGKTT